MVGNQMTGMQPAASQREDEMADTGKHQESIEEYSRAIELDAKDITAYFSAVQII